MKRSTGLSENFCSEKRAKYIAFVPPERAGKPNAKVDRNNDEDRYVLAAWDNGYSRARLPFGLILREDMRGLLSWKARTKRDCGSAEALAISAEHPKY